MVPLRVNVNLKATTVEVLRSRRKVALFCYYWVPFDRRQHFKIRGLNKIHRKKKYSTNRIILTSGKLSAPYKSLCADCITYYILIDRMSLKIT